MGFPTSHRLSVYIAPKSRKGWLKGEFIDFVNKNQFLSNKDCYRVSSCENIQWHSCSATVDHI